MNELQKIENAPTINVEGIKKSIQESQKLAQETHEMHKRSTTYEDMKNSRTKVRKVINDIDERRKGFTASLDEFKIALKSSYDSVMEDLLKLDKDFKKELDKLDNQAKEEKRAEIKTLADYDEYIQYFEFKDKWLNKSYSINKIEDEMAKAVEQIERDKTSVHNFATAYGMEDSGYYMAMLKTKDVNAIQEQIKADKERLEAQAKAKAEQVTPKSQGNDEPTVYSTDEEIKKAGPNDIIKVNRTIKGEKWKVQKLRAYADELGVEWIQ